MKKQEQVAMKPAVLRDGL